MASVNKCIVVGYVGKDPEMRTFPSGDQIANITVATTDKWKDKQSGEMKEATEWHRIVFNGRLAEVVGQYLRKGSQVYVEGSLRTRKWTDKDGAERYTTEIRGDSMQMLGSKPGGSRNDSRDAHSDYGDSRQTAQERPAAAPRAPYTPHSAPARQPAMSGGGGGGGFPDDDDIPFREPDELRFPV